MIDEMTSEYVIFLRLFLTFFSTLDKRLRMSVVDTVTDFIKDVMISTLS